MDKVPQTSNIEGGSKSRLEKSVLPFFEAAESGRLVIQTCRACRENYFYPRPFCPNCASSDVAWIECSGSGQIYSHTYIPRGKPAPLIIAYVKLQEGPTVLTRIVDAVPERVIIGHPVQARFAPGPGGLPILLFSLITNSNQAEG